MDEMHVSVLRFPDGRAFVGDPDAVEQVLRDEVGLPCTLCFGAGFIETDGFDGPREIECPQCGGEGGPYQEPPALSAADLIV